MSTPLAWLSTSLNAYLFVTHGSRDPRSQRAALRLAEQFRDRLGQPPLVLDSYGQDCSSATRSTGETRSTMLSRPVAVGTAALECMPEPLHQQIIAFAQPVAQAGGKTVTIVPLFLLPGVHVMEDLPQQISIAQQALAESQTAVMLKMMPFLGSDPELLPLLQQQFDQALPPQTPAPSQSPLLSPIRILLAHGSRRPGGNTIVEQLAQALDAQIAYWSIAPSLEDCLNQSLHRNVSPETNSENHLPSAAEPAVVNRPIVILPYFLSEGGITDAIAEQVRSWSHRPNRPQVQLLSTLDTNPALVDLILKQLKPECVHP
ncbi:sirohydrochlorin chelatase [Alkalinema sp. FACHB-956]|uniref:sirohydrochlorin chelatase n=1 Tax=Alkalinema sp. FACHB-956 TaxID=2692768 RepID=UPI0016859E8B|nr:sirohydrochlorin chelatase [Alkalinema sp. FACHB-956]MBD2325622.1 sirohydrochlorin chelatase [Alkalinema sp. FACHB-956]